MQLSFWRKSSRRSVSSLFRHQDGGIVVEFALVAPILILVMTGIIQFGAAMFILNNMENVARDASRRAATGEFSAAQAETYAAGTLVDWGINYNISVTIDTTTRDVVAVISAPLNEAAIIDYLGILSGRTITAAATMRWE